MGEHRDVPIEKFDPAQLLNGTEVEMEHTENECEAAEIAKDHLTEIPDYYTRLAKMERPDFWELLKEENRKPEPEE